MKSIMEHITTKNGGVPHLTGTPHVHGAKAAVGQVRSGLHALVTTLAKDWTTQHPLDGNKTTLELIDLVDQLGPAEQHALRIAASMLVRISRQNGYHTA